MSWLSDGALPMGMLFFGIMVLGSLRRKAGNVVARSQYPSLAQKLGLAYKPSAFKQGVGKLEGRFEGFGISVDPDDQRRIFVRFATAPDVRLYSYPHNKRPVAGMMSFRPVNSSLAARFKTAQGSREMIDRFTAAEGDLAPVLRPLQFLRQLKTLTVTDSGVTAVFDYGNPPYIPAEVVDDMLPRLARLARVFEGPFPVADSPGSPESA